MAFDKSEPKVAKLKANCDKLCIQSVMSFVYDGTKALDPEKQYNKETSKYIQKIMPITKLVQIIKKMCPYPYYLCKEYELLISNFIFKFQLPFLVPHPTPMEHSIASFWMLPAVLWVSGLSLLSE